MDKDTSNKLLNACNETLTLHNEIIISLMKDVNRILNEITEMKKDIMELKELNKKELNNLNKEEEKEI